MVGDDIAIEIVGLRQGRCAASRIAIVGKAGEKPWILDHPIGHDWIPRGVILHTRAVAVTASHYRQRVDYDMAACAL